MKKIFKVLLLVALSAMSVFGRSVGVITDEKGELKKPSKTVFAQKNNLVSNATFSVFVDLFRAGIDDVAGMRHDSLIGYAIYWTDCELKVLNEVGKIVYFFSTNAFANKQVQALHDSKYNDNEATVYYYVSGGNSSNGVCVKPKKKLTNFNLSIGAIENANNGISSADDGRVRITGIQIYPSEKFRDVFLNPKNSIMVWRQSINAAETDGQGGKLWRPAIVQFAR